MPVQSQLFPEPPAPELSEGQERGANKAAPLWLQRMSLFVLVLFCIYLGVLVAVLPWWTRIWDDNLLMMAYPKVGAFLRMGAVRGVITGLGLIDIWIGVSEAIHYRDYRPGR